MESLENKLKKSGYYLINPKLYAEIVDLENRFNGLKSDHMEGVEMIAEYRKKENADQDCLTDISRKLNTTLKNLGEDEMIKDLMLQRAKILDHFTMAYMADSKLKPKELKLIQSVNENNEIEMYFEKHSLIIV